MKKLVAFVILTLSILLALAYWFERAVILSSSISGASKINRILNVSEDNEIPIFGSSRARRNYVPSILGEDFFNYGIEGIQDNVVLFFLEEELEKDRTTPIIVNYDLDGLNSIIGDIGNYLPFLGNEKVVALVGDQYKPYYGIPYLRYYGHFESYVRDYLNESLEQNEVEDHGAALYTGKVDDKTFKKYVKNREKSHVTVKHDEKLYEKLITLCGSTDRTILFVITPNHMSYVNSIVNMEKNEELFEELKTFPNVRIINFAQVEYPDEYYFNTTHMNYLGAKVFSEQLKDSLKHYIEIEP